MFSLNVFNLINVLLCFVGTASTDCAMRMASCLILCLFIFLKSSAKATEPSVFLRCNPKEHIIEYGRNLNITCVLNSSNHYKPCAGKDELECQCSSERPSCTLKTINATDNQRIRQETVEIDNVTITGNYTISMYTTCGHKVKDSIKINVIPPSEKHTQLSEMTSPVIGTVSVALALVAIVALVILWIKKHRRDKITTTRHHSDYHEPLQQTC